jgi:hypothetical protein
MNPQQNQQLNPLAEPITQALGYTENGGKPDISNPSSGKTGEMKSIFQFEPNTWKAYSQQVVGKPLPMTADNESYVVLHKVNNWANQLQKEGYSQDKIPSMIASMWNAGPGEPMAYTGKFSDGTSSKGVNEKYGVKYDVPGYVNRFNNYFEKFSNQSTNTPKQAPVQNQTANTSAPIQTVKKVEKKKSSGQMQGLNQGNQTPVMKSLSLS